MKLCVVELEIDFLDLNELPVAKYRIVISSFGAVGMAILILVSFPDQSIIICSKTSEWTPMISVDYRIFVLQLFQ